MSKLVFFVCSFIFLGDCNCKIIPLTEEEIEDGFTIVLPRQGKYSLLQCYLRIALDDVTKTDFYPTIDLKKTNINRDGIEYVPDYYETGNNDSCTFRIYPKKLDKISDIYQMRYWNIIMKNRNQDAYVKWRLPEEIAIKTLFYMNSWSWWKEHHVNTLILQLSNPLIFWNRFLASDIEYLYVERKIKQALTVEEMEDGFTIVLPRQEKYSLLQCYLRIAKNADTKSDFYPAIDIKRTIKNRDGIEFVPNYYQTGNNDSCTFRVYPNILDKFFDSHQMRYWNIIMRNLIQEGNRKWLLVDEWGRETALFYMNTWSWWIKQHVNTLILQFANPLIPWNQVLASDFEYLYVERNIKQALTEEEMEDGFTIVLPRQEKYSLLQCYLRIAKNNETKFNFYPAIDIKKTIKNRDGIEYVRNYYQSGNDDSCTFRVYPNIIKQFYNIYQMRYWNITMKNRIQEAVVHLRLEEEWDIQSSLFFMNSWSWWKEQRVNTLILQFSNPPIRWNQFRVSDYEYLYVDRKVENALTIILPQEKESESIACFLKIAVNGTTTEEFESDGKDIRLKNKWHDGMEYFANYYNSGKNDSCTFRIYPEILYKLSNGHNKYQMRYWEITTYLMNAGEVDKKIILFHMDSWWSWKHRKYVNTLELKESSLSKYATCNYRYI